MIGSTNKPLVSVCIPTYNGCPFIKESLECILNQSYCNIEIIVIDDGSTDNTIEHVKSYQKVFKNIILFENKENLGLVENWNRCIHEASGDWIKFHFQDDLAEPNCIEKMMEIVLQMPKVRLIISDRQYIFEDDIKQSKISFYQNRLRRLGHYFPNSTFVTVERLSEIWFENLLGHNFLGEPIVGIFKKDLVQTYGLFDSNLKQIVDFEFWARIAINEGFYYFDEPLVSFRVHQSSATASNSKKQNVSVIDRFILAHKVKFDPVFESFRSSLHGKHNLFRELDIELLKQIKTLQMQHLKFALDNLKASYPFIFPNGFKRTYYLALVKNVLKAVNRVTCIFNS